MGTGGHSAFPRSVAEKILGRARCPVLAVPAGALPLSESLFETVLWATDFSSHAALAHRYAVSIAVRTGARLLRVHAVEGGDDERARKAGQRLQEAVTASREAGCEVEAIVTTARPSRSVLEIAREREAELIVMGVQGSHALHTLFFGSTARRVVRDPPCAVLAVRRT